MLGDSIVKHVQEWDITKRIDNKRKVYVRQFPGSKVDCIKDYLKPCTRENNPDDLIFDVRTNKVPSNKKAKSMAESIVSLAKEVKASKLDVSISSIIPRNDNWNNKVMEVNSYWKDLCEGNDIPFISSTTINPQKYLNSRVQLNSKGLTNFVIILLGIWRVWLVDKLLKETGQGGVVDQRITFVLQLLKLLITKNLVLNIRVFLEKNI